MLQKQQIMQKSNFSEKNEKNDYNRICNERTLIAQCLRMQGGKSKCKRKN